MEFFRKYQRAFFTGITAIVICSFVFFGALSTFVDQPAIEDRVVSIAIDGSKLMESEVRQLARFISTDRQDIAYKNGLLPNFCNDGVIRFDLIQTGLALVLVDQYYDALKEPLQERLDRIKRFQPYAHPEAPFISAKAVWDRFVPGLSQEILALQAEEKVSNKVFDRLTHIYELEGRCPSEWVRRILLLQKQQHSWLKPDPRLEREDLSVFGFHTAADWFGNDFIDLCAQFILNTARIAEQKGYKVSLEEAKADLINHFSFTAQKIKEAGQQEIFPDLHFRDHLQRLGFDEKSAAVVWRNVLLFRRYFQSVGQAAFIDRLPFTDFASFALESAVVQLYEWPKALRLKNFSDLIQFQYYVKAVSKQTSDLLALPTEILPIEEVEAQYPELVQTTYSAQIVKASKEEVGLRASVKEIWDWQLQNWETLQNRFSFLSHFGSREERFKCLENLPALQRSQLDSFTRKALVAAHPEWIEQVCDRTGRTEQIQISKTRCSLPKIKKIENFYLSLETACLTEMPFRYSDDEETFYQISCVKKIEDRHLLTFESAKAQGILSSQIDLLLEGQYSNIRTKNPKPFQTEEGRWRPFAEVKDLVARYLYADLLKAIDISDPTHCSPGEGPLESYASRRLLSQTRSALSDLKSQFSDAKWVQGANDDLLLAQFKLERKEHHIQRIAKEEWMKEEAFTMLPNEWSTIHVAADGEIAFFYYQEKKPHQTPILEQLVGGKETIAADAQRFLAERLIFETKKKQSIIIPIRGPYHESF